MSVNIDYAGFVALSLLKNAMREEKNAICIHTVVYSQYSKHVNRFLKCMNIKTTHAIQDGTFTGSGTKRTWCEPLEEVSTGMPVPQASRTFNVPQNTLGGSPEDENAPVQYCVYCAHHG